MLASPTNMSAEKWMMFEHTIRFPNKRAFLVLTTLYGVYCKRDNRAPLFVLGDVGMSEGERTLRCWMFGSVIFGADNMREF